MKKHLIPLAILAVIISAGFSLSCLKRAADDIDADNIHINLFINENARLNNTPPVVAILDIALTTGWSDLKKAGLQKEHIEASHREKMENGLLQNGFLLVDSSRTNALLKERALSGKGITENNSLIIGKLLGADIVISGIIPVCQHNDDLPDCKGGVTGFLEVIIKGIHVQTGEIVFQGIIDHRYCCSSMAKYPYNMSLVENEIYSRVGAKLHPLSDNKYRNEYAGGL